MYLHQEKLGTIPKCVDCKVKLHGVSHVEAISRYGLLSCCRVDGIAVTN